MAEENMTTVNTTFDTKPQNLNALLSFIFSLMFFIIPVVASVVSIVLGHLALKDIKQNPHQEGAGLAKAGLIISYIVLGSGVLLTLLLIAIIGAAAAAA